MAKSDYVSQERTRSFFERARVFALHSAVEVVDRAGLENTKAEMLKAKNLKLCRAALLGMNVSGLQENVAAT
jgi:hypothetical protein